MTVASPPQDSPRPLPVKRSRLSRRFRLWSRRVSQNRTLAFLVAAAAVASGIATFATMAGNSAQGPDPGLVLGLLYVDAVLLLLLGVIVARRLVAVWAERRRGLAGSRLHIRLVVLFSLVAVTPAILVAVFSALFLNFGVQAWFSERVRTAIEESRAVAKAYLHEHQQTIRADILAIANDLNREAAQLTRSRPLFARVLSAQAAFRGLPEASVVDSQGTILAASEFSLSTEIEDIPHEAFDLADSGEVVVLTHDQDDRVRAMVQLQGFVDAFLVVDRYVAPRVLDHIRRTDLAVQQYRGLEKRREGTQITFVAIFGVVALLLLLAAVWIGLTLANQIARPVTRLIEAAEGVGKGNLGLRVETAGASDEFATLSRAFNRMTSQLEAQQASLIEANRQLDERRRFTETVLAGVSAGVIGLDAEGRIHLPNRSASELLGINLDGEVGSDLADVVPEMAELLGQARARPERLHQAEIKVVRDRRARTLLSRMTGERLEGDVIGFVVTFDDITDLLSAQRKAAWADVARRIAHEIKNPLTPIQLSAERLKRKYLKQISDDPATFTTCTETIVRQVEDIGRMVDEFSAFARMPEASMRDENLSDLCHQAVFLERNRHADIRWDLALPEHAVHLHCDARQIARALTNLLKNAAESVVGREAPADAAGPVPGWVRLSLRTAQTERGHVVTLEVEDNGRGLPEEHIDRLTEPYVTTREKGTGLGLAIVKKIVEDHDGDLLLENRAEGGARITVIFRPSPKSEGTSGEGESPARTPMDVATGILAHGA